MSASREGFEGFLNFWKKREMSEHYKVLQTKWNEKRDGNKEWRKQHEIVMRAGKRMN